MDSPPTHTLTPNATTTYLTATSKMNRLAPKRVMRNLLKVTAIQNRDSRACQTQKRPTPLSSNPRHHAHCQLRQAGSKTMTGQPHLLSNLCSLTKPRHRPNNNLARMGKVAIIRDMGAVT